MPPHSNTPSGALPDASPVRCLAVWLLASGVLGGLLWLLLLDLSAATGTIATDLARQPFDRLLEWWCAGVGAVGCAWLWSATTLVTLQAARGRAHGPVRGVPAPVRRLVLAACGAALAAGVAGPAVASPGGPHLDHPRAAAALVQGLPLPDRATGGLRGARGASRPAEPTAPVAGNDTVVVVRTGDTLWDLAGRTLPAAAGTAEVAERAQRLYALNRAVIGPDPDLIRPGQHLRLPRP